MDNSVTRDSADGKWCVECVLTSDPSRCETTAQGRPGPPVCVPSTDRVRRQDPV